MERKILTFYDIVKQANSSIELTHSINDLAESILLKNKIYIIGGRGNSCLTFYVDFNSKSLIAKRDMLIGKYGHSLCSAQNDIYSIGGWMQSNCQRYSVLNDKWTSLPYLQVGRGYCASFELKNNMYALGGFDNQLSMRNMVEKMDILCPTNWKDVKITNIFTLRHYVQSIKIRNNEVISFGGFPRIRQCFIQKLDENGDIICKQSSGLAIGGNFCFTSAPIFDGVCVYAVDNDRKMHYYSVRNKKWGLL